jgi:transcriptional antiterminator Rof (Rho-off)
MAYAQRVIFFVFCVSVSFGQRAPQSLFDSVAVTAEQEMRILALDTITIKTQAEREELAMLFASTKRFENSFELLSVLCEEYPDNFDYQLPRVKSLPYVRAMKIAFEAAARLKPDALDIQIVLLQLYTELPWVLGGSNKKATQVLEIVKSLSVIEGFLAEGYFYRSTKKNKEALVAYLNAVNEIQSCNQDVEMSIDSYYHLAVLAFYLQKDKTKAACLFSMYIKKFDDGAAYPKSFAQHYLSKVSDSENVDLEMEAKLLKYDKLTAWIQNNFK